MMAILRIVWVTGEIFLFVRVRAFGRVDYGGWGAAAANCHTVRQSSFYQQQDSAHYLRRASAQSHSSAGPAAVDALPFAVGAALSRFESLAALGKIEKRSYE
jgi:hypothetical protein